MTAELVELNWSETRDQYLPTVVELESVFGMDAMDSDELDSFLSRSEHIMAVVDQGELVCYTATEFDPQDPFSQYIWQMVTAPGHRGQGHASRVLTALIDFGTALHLHVRADNEEAIGLYIDAGFTIQQVVPKYYASGIDALRLVYAI